MNKVFAKKLKELRKEKGLTQSEMADILKVGARQYQRYENDIVPKTDKISLLNKELGYDFFKLLKHDGKVPHGTVDFEVHDDGDGEFYTPSGKMNMGDRAMIIALKEIVAKLMVGNPKFSNSLQGCLDEIDEHTTLVLNRLLNTPS